MMRSLNQEEYNLIVYLLKDKPEYRHLIEGLSNSTVQEMNDGGMGSLKFEDKKGIKRMSEEIVAICLSDVDGTPLGITLNIDTNGDLYELDVFKADFSPLIAFPTAPYIELPNNKS